MDHSSAAGNVSIPTQRHYQLSLASFVPVEVFGVVDSVIEWKGAILASQSRHDGK